jgi:hypothetical protein
MNSVLENILIAYFIVSILIEVFDLICFFTPSTEDDKVVSKIKEYWGNISKVALFVSIRTPITLFLMIMLSVLTNIVAFIKRR